MTTLLIAALALTAGELQPQDNFLENPSMETDCDRDTFPDGWRPYAYDSPARLAWDATVARTGGRSLQISDSFRAEDQADWQRCTGRWVSPPRPIEPGTEYTLEVWVKTDRVSGRANAHLAWQRGGQWLSEVPTPAVSGTGDWRKLTVSAIAPAGADTVTVSLNLARSKGTAWFDDTSVSGNSDALPHVEYTFHDTSDWFPFSFPLDDTNLDGINLTDLLDAPAGKHGFVTVRADGHFYFEDGKRARFFGTNVGGAACAPENAQARVIAARLAKYGVNMLRLHSMDSRYGPLIDYSRGDTQHFDAEGLDRVDYFVSQLKHRGIYVYLDLLDYRQFRTADGVKHGDEFTHNWAGSMKGASIFDERMIELQKDYAARLLTHKNPYTGLRYVDDPAIALVEITNENSVFYFLLNGSLSLPYYRQQLQQRWNDWLASRYGGRAELAEAWIGDRGRGELLGDEDPRRGSVQLPAAELARFSRGFMQDRGKYRWGPARTRDALRFLGEIQQNYYRQMRTHLKEKIGLRVPVTGTNQTFILRDTEINAGMSDFISRNQYWRHPSRNAKPFFKFSNQPRVRSDLAGQRGPFTVFAGSSVSGKPLVLAEFNFPWPNEYRCEGLLMAAAYACLQDWDAVLLFSYDPEEKLLGMFRCQSDPARWGEYPAAAMLFHRHDVAAARNEVHVVHTPEAVAQVQPDERYAPFTNFRYLAFLSKVRRSFLGERGYEGGADVVLACGQSADAKVRDGTKVIRLPEMPWQEWLYPKFVEAARKLNLPGYRQIDAGAKRFRSDTGELWLDYERGLFTANSPNTKMAIGYLAGAGPIDLGGMRIDCKTNFAAITATSLDGEPIGRSHHLLVTCVARAENTAQGFWPSPPNPKSWSPFMTWMLPAEGRLPVIAEPVRAEVRLKVLGPAVVYALDATGKRRDRIEAAVHSGALAVNLAAARSVWCEIVVP